MKSVEQLQLEDEINELRSECQARDYELEHMWTRLRELEQELYILIGVEHETT